MPVNEIEVALWPRGPQAETFFPSVMQRYHEQPRLARVRYHWMDMKNPWAEVNRTMINKIGADVTEVGASWVESLVAANCLRPFLPQEFQSLGGSGAFIMPAWKSQKAYDKEFVFSIPQSADARHVYYRRDMLAKAAVDETTAFATPQNFLQTLESLRRAGIKYPLIAAISTPFVNLSLIASWVWGVGADFIDSAGTRATFDQPEAIAGMADYFRAAEYIAPEFRQLDILQTDREFCQGNAAITLSGSWLYHTIHKFPAWAYIRDNMGLALPVGQGSCGGTHLVIWQHSAQEDAALEFVHYLNSPQVQADLSTVNFVLPTRLDANKLSPHADDPNYQMLVETIRTGRSYGASPFWNSVEDRLARLLVQLWSEYFATPGVDANAFLAARLEPLAKRINVTLEG
ncbi:MAG: extracellular solute-binding protein [Anaerolineales bacterium]